MTLNPEEIKKIVDFCDDVVNLSEDKSLASESIEVKEMLKLKELEQEREFEEEYSKLKSNEE